MWRTMSALCIRTALEMSPMMPIPPHRTSLTCTRRRVPAAAAWCKRVRQRRGATGYYRVQWGAATANSPSRVKSRPHGTPRLPQPAFSQTEAACGVRHVAVAAMAECDVRRVPAAQAGH